jgi:hypothetical protein
MKRPRITIRRLLALVMIAVFLSGFVCLGRIGRYRQKAHMFRTLAANFRAQASGSKSDPIVSAAYAADARHMEEVARRYEFAAQRPWRSVQPDPAESR